jgi:hypothetical protein
VFYLRALSSSSFLRVKTLFAVGVAQRQQDTGLKFVGLRIRFSP